MKAIINPRILLFQICLVTHLSCTMLRAQDHFTKNEVLEDMAFLWKSLEEAHFDLYAYTPKEEFEKNYNRVKNTISKDSLSLLEATSIFQKVISKADNGHTEIGFPGKSYGSYAYSGGTLFPLEIALENGKALVRKNWSGNHIPTGAEILSINHIPISEILAEMYTLISAERPYFKNAKIELYSFPRLYWQLYGRQDNFEIKFKSNDITKTQTVAAVGLIEGYEMKRTELFNRERSLQFIGESAYLVTGDFSGDETKFKRFMDSSFAQIKDRKSKNLIVDLRNNGGGHNAFSDYLVSYFADTTFRWNSSYQLKTSKFLKEHARQHYDTTSAFWKEALSHENGEIYNYDFGDYQPQPPSKRFSGKVYVLVNRQSHSQATVTAAQIQDYGFGTIVGEETGEYASLYASMFEFKLPHTQIPVSVSKGKMVRVSGSTKEEGVVPDIYIKDHLLDDKDEILEGLLEKISESD
ncbi:S41 family peptidase [Flagellimonas marinaquae]|uniref:S41 family peptidase n=1 Tax=Flagellimonas marinaquae TaxID=254955 RepID=UPI001F492FD8|nr:S41 family peptidase [Allomuricauda aquimarina]